MLKQKFYLQPTSEVGDASDDGPNMVDVLTVSTSSVTADLTTSEDSFYGSANDENSEYHTAPMTMSGRVSNLWFLTTSWEIIHPIRLFVYKESSARCIALEHHCAGSKLVGEVKFSKVFPVGRHLRDCISFVLSCLWLPTSLSLQPLTDSYASWGSPIIIHGIVIYSTVYLVAVLVTRFSFCFHNPTWSIHFVR